MMVCKRVFLPLFVVIGLVASLVLVSSAVAQQGVKAPDFGAHPELSEISDELSEMWADDPQVFARLEAVRQLVRDWEQSGAQREMNPARVLEGLGEEGVLVLLWALVADDPMEQQMGLRGWITWRVGLLEAVGRQRDKRSLPILLAIIDGPDPFGVTHRTATSAIGRTGDVAAIERVIDVARDDDERRPAIVAGLGQARRTVALDYLLDVAGDGDDLQVQRRALRSLGDWANQWAWQTSHHAGRAKIGEEGRSRIIDELIDFYGQAEPVLRREIEKSLQLAGAAQASERARERGLSEPDPEIAAAYQGLVDRLERSPLN